MAASTVTPEAAPAGTSPEKDVAASTSAAAAEPETSAGLAARAKKLMSSFKGFDSSKVEVAEEDDQAPPTVRTLRWLLKKFRSALFL